MKEKAAAWCAVKKLQHCLVVRYETHNLLQHMTTYTLLGAHAVCWFASSAFLAFSSPERTRTAPAARILHHNLGFLAHFAILL